MVNPYEFRANSRRFRTFLHRVFAILEVIGWTAVLTGLIWVSLPLFGMTLPQSASTLPTLAEMAQKIDQVVTDGDRSKWLTLLWGLAALATVLYSCRLFLIQSRGAWIRASMAAAIAGVVIAFPTVVASLSISPFYLTGILLISLALTLSFRLLSLITIPIVAFLGSGLFITGYEGKYDLNDPLFTVPMVYAAVLTILILLGEISLPIYRRGGRKKYRSEVKSARLYIEKNQVNLALNKLEEAVLIQPKNPDTLWLLAECLFYLKRSEQARPIYQVVLGRSSGKQRQLVDERLLLLAKGDFPNFVYLNLSDPKEQFHPPFDQKRRERTR